MNTAMAMDAPAASSNFISPPPPPQQQQLNEFPTIMADSGEEGVADLLFYQEDLNGLVSMLVSMLSSIVCYNDKIPTNLQNLTRFHSKSLPGITIHEVGGLTSSELSRLEFDFLELIGYDVNVQLEILQKYYHSLKRQQLQQQQQQLQARMNNCRTLPTSNAMEMLMSNNNSLNTGNNLRPVSPATKLSVFSPAGAGTIVSSYSPLKSGRLEICEDRLSSQQSNALIQA